MFENRIVKSREYNMPLVIGLPEQSFHVQCCSCQHCCKAASGRSTAVLQKRYRGVMMKAYKSVPGKGYAHFWVVLLVASVKVGTTSNENVLDEGDVGSMIDADATIAKHHRWALP